MANPHQAEDPAPERPTGGVADGYLWAFVRRQGGQWHATAIDYSIVGSGDSPEEALESLNGLVAAYLDSCAREGLSSDDARRPVSLGWSLSFAVDGFRRAFRLARRKDRGSPRGQVWIPRVGC